MKFVLGLTGGIASGKTAVSDILAAKSIPIIDADVISRNITKEGSKCNEEVKLAFPSCVNDGALDRKKLRELVFNDQIAREKLNSITHPYIFSEIKAELDKADGLVVLSAPLLFECGLEKLCDKVAVVSTNEDERIKRVIERDNISKELAIKIINSQVCERERLSRSNFVIFNDSGLDCLALAVDDLLKKLVEVGN